MRLDKRETLVLGILEQGDIRLQAVVRSWPPKQIAALNQLYVKGLAHVGHSHAVISDAGRKTLAGGES